MLELAARFLVIGALAFGGGQTAPPLVERLAVADIGWLTPVQFAIGVGLSYATPGPVLILAAFIGYHVAVPGAAAVVFTITVQRSEGTGARKGPNKQVAGMLQRVEYQHGPDPE